ncbi:hypothetical protein CFP56_008703, partial [Quercus suber]
YKQQNISAIPQAVGVSIGQSFGQVSHELIVSKPEPSQVVNLPIEFVPAVLPEPSDRGLLTIPLSKNKKGFFPVFTSTLVFNGLYYTGEVGRNKKEAEQLVARVVIISLLGKYGLETVLSETIKSKDKLYVALHKLKDTSHENISVVPQAVGVSIRTKFWAS